MRAAVTGASGDAMITGMIPAFLALLLGAPAPMAAQRPVAQPVAVMPFKNLNTDTTLDWLKVGMAETMVSDLRKTGKVRVVEREQIDRALGEILLQGQRGTDEGDAAKVGRLVGAKTVVLGSFQQAQKQVRITARFVSVESGEVLDTAKTTGPIDRIFALQDEVVDRLLGAPPPRPKRKTTPKAVEAYKLYSMSLVTSSDAEKVDYLRRSLEQDPELTYALDDLAALEQRIAAYRSAREGLLPGQDLVLWQRVTDPKLTPYERALAADNMLQVRLDERRYRALRADAEKLLAMDLPAPPPGTTAPPHDAALYALFLALDALRERDRAVQTGEQYLKRFPTGFYYQQVEVGVARLVTERKHAQANESFFAERFERIEQTREEEKGKLSGDELAFRMRQLDHERCDVLWRFRSVLHARVVEECGAVVAKYRDDPHPAAREMVRMARRNVIVALGELGKFDQAVPMARALAGEGDLNLERQMKELLEETWPRDALP